MKRWVNVMITVLALTVGGLMYVVLREKSYLANIFAGSPLLAFLRAVFSGNGWRMASCYLPDFLWSLALTCALIALFQPSKAGCSYCALVGMLCGLIWEVLQTLRIVSGTGDIWDILAYSSAATMGFFINTKERKR